MTHPPREALREYATGDAALTRRLLVEAHLAFCPACRHLLAEYWRAEPGLPEAADDDAIRAPSFDRVWEAAERVAARTRAPGAAVLPPSLLAALPDPAGWKWVVVWPPRVRSALLVRDPDAGSELYLSYLPPRSRYPRHRHLGLEETVIVSGSGQNGAVRVNAGDWVVQARETEHATATGPDEDCWCLSCLEPPGVRFSGWRGWLQRLRRR